MLFRGQQGLLLLQKQKVLIKNIITSPSLCVNICFSPTKYLVAMKILQSALVLFTLFTKLNCGLSQITDQSAAQEERAGPETKFVSVPDGYKDVTAQEKETFTMQQVMATRGTRSRFATWWEAIRFMTEDIWHVFDSHSDLLSLGHPKRIHGVGFTGAVEMVSSGDHPFTGLFQGAPFGVIRFSTAMSAPNETGMKPGIGVKFFIDGVESANFVAMESNNGQESGNIFEADFSTVIPELPLGLASIGVLEFRRVSSPENAVGLLKFAQKDVDGSSIPEDDVTSPYQLILKPNPELSAQFQDVAAGTDLLETFSQIPAGTVRYDIYGEPAPGAEEIMIGQLKSKSEIVDSIYGDESLFFRHQRPSVDFERHPEWAPPDWDPEESILETMCPFLRNEN